MKNSTKRISFFFIILFCSLISTPLFVKAQLSFNFDAGSAVNSPAGGWTNAGVGTYYRSTSTSALNFTTLAAACNGHTKANASGGSVIFFQPAVDITAISISGTGTGSNRTYDNIATSSTIGGTYTNIAGASGSGGIGTGGSANCGTISITNIGTITAGTFIRISFSGNVNTSRIDITPAAATTPTTQATNINFTNVAQTSLTVSWTRGNGNNVAVFMKQGPGTITNPVDGVEYTANAALGTGTQLGTSGYYCIYNGNGTSVNVTGLSTSTTYYVQAFEYSGITTNTKYLTSTSTNNPNSQTTAAPPSDYRSSGSGDWSSVGSWETYNGTSWVVASSAPNLAAANITIRSGHIINVTADVSVDEFTIQNGGGLNVNSGVLFSVVDGAGTDITLNGTIKNSGTFTVASGATMTVSATGVYEDAQPATTSPIVIPTATWTSGSTFVLSGLVGVSASDYSGLQGIKQTFSNFRINTPNLLGKLLLTATGGASAPYMTIAGTLTIDATGTGTGVQLLNTNQNGNALSVGNYIQNGGNVFVLHNASSNATRNFNVNGDFTLNNNSSFDIANTTGTSATNITYTNITGNIAIASTATLKRTQAAGGPIAALILNGTSAQTASFGLTSGLVNYTLNNTTGVTLSSDLTVNGTLTLNSGNVITGNNKVTISSTGSITGAGATRWVQGTLQKNVATGATSTTFEIGDAAAYKPVTVAFGNVTTAGDITASISQTAGDHPDVANSGIDAMKSVNKFWTVTNTGVVFDNYTLTLNFAAADVDGTANTGNFIVKKLDGTTWSTPTVGTKSATSIEATGLTSFSQFAVGEAAATMPVTLSNFKGEVLGSVNKLYWTTSTEVNNKGFEVERSVDGRTFTSIGFVSSKGDRGNSSSALNYGFDDLKPFNGTSYYRLKQVDNNGKSTLSTTVNLTHKTDGITITRTYPNPTSTELTVVINSSKKEMLRMIVTDISGKVVLRTDVNLQSGTNKHTINTSNLSPGTYMIKFICTEGCELKSEHFIKQ